MKHHAVLRHQSHVPNIIQLSRRTSPPLPQIGSVKNLQSPPRMAEAGRSITALSATSGPSPVSHSHRPTFATTTTAAASSSSSPTAAAPPVGGRVAELQAERAAAAAQLARVDRELRRELGRWEDDGGSDAGGQGQQGGVEDGVVTEAEVLDNFGYIRQFSGEPYDYSQPMGVSQMMHSVGGCCQCMLSNWRNQTAPCAVRGHALWHCLRERGARTLQ